MPTKRSKSSKPAASRSSSSSSSSLWSAAPTEFTRRSAFTLIYGDTSTGRTTLALTSPGPIAYLHCAEKIQGVIQPFAAEKEIRTFNFGGIPPGTPDEVAKAGTDLWLATKERWIDAFSWARTVILDTDTDLWELIRLAYFGDVKPSGGRLELNWGPVNADWKSLFRFARDHEGVNTVLIGKTTDEYKESKKGFGTKTGNTIRSGQKDIPFMSDVIVRTDVDVVAQTYSVTIEKPWWNGDLTGVEFSNERGEEINDLPLLLGMITETDPDEWR